MKVTLSKAVPFPPPYGLMRHSGTVLDVTDEELAQLEELGAVAAPVVVDDAPVEHTPAAEPVDDAPVEHTPADVAPKKAASLEKWQEYARSKGIDPKGLNKAEIIAATT